MQRMRASNAWTSVARHELRRGDPAAGKELVCGVGAVRYSAVSICTVEVLPVEERALDPIRSGRAHVEGPQQGLQRPRRPLRSLSGGWEGGQVRPIPGACGRADRVEACDPGIAGPMPFFPSISPGHRAITPMSFPWSPFAEAPTPGNRVIMPASLPTLRSGSQPATPRWKGIVDSVSGVASEPPVLRGCWGCSYPAPVFGSSAGGTGDCAATSTQWLAEPDARPHFRSTWAKRIGCPEGYGSGPFAHARPRWQGVRG